MGKKPLTIAMVAGEPSGDRQGAALLRALRERAHPRTVDAWGIGGDAMRQAGVEIRHDSTRWATIGVVNAIVNLPHLLSVMAEMKRALRRDPPDVLVTIDAGAFNVPLGRWTRRRHLCPVFYYFPPGSWRRSARSGRSGLADAADSIVTPFAWSKEILQRGGAPAEFVGHPLLDLVSPTLAEEEFHSRYGLDPRRPLVALLPGSRSAEVANILPVLIGAAGEITKRIPGVQFAVALPSPALRAQVENIVRHEQRRGGRAARLQLLMHQAGDRLAQIAHSAQTSLSPPLLTTNEGLTLPALTVEDEIVSERSERAGPAPLVICEGLTYDVLARSDLVITKSGTSTLEAAILQKPMIIVYRGSALMAAEWQIRKRSLNIAHIGMPNILAEERLFPELIQDEATPDAISELAVEMLLQPERLLHFKQKLVDLIRANLGEPGGVARAADLLYDLAVNGTGTDEHDD